MRWGRANVAASSSFSFGDVRAHRPIQGADCRGAADEGHVAAGPADLLRTTHGVHTGAVAVAGAVVGRERELLALAQFLDDVGDGPICLALWGEAGGGKSTVW